MEHDGLNIAQNPEMFWVGYLYDIFLVHLDQTLAVTVQAEFRGVDEVIVAALGSVLECRYLPVHR